MPDKTFLFNSHGYAITGNITRPYTESIDVQAANSVSTLGGNGLVESEKYYSPSKTVYYDYAGTQVASSVNPEDGSLNLLMTSMIEGLDILGTVTADRLVLKLSLKHLPGEDEAHIVSLGTKIDNLVVAGSKVDVEFDHELFTEHDTFSSLKKRYIEDPDFRQSARKQFGWGDYESGTPDFITKRFQWHTNPDTPPESKGLLPCTLVKKLTPQSNALKVYGHIIHVKQFGYVHIGETFLQQNSKRIRLLNLDLGSPVNGSIGGPDGTTTGCEFP